MTGSGVFVLRWGDDAATVPPTTDRVVLHTGRDERWLLLDAPERFAGWVAMVASQVPIGPSWTTIEGLNDWPVRAYVSSLRRLATGRLLRALDHQLAGHVLATAALRAAHPGASVDVGFVHHDAYELEGLLRDVLDAAAVGVPRAELGDHLRRRRAEHERDVPPRDVVARLRRRLVATAVPLELALPRSIGAVYAAAEAAVR